MSSNARNLSWFSTLAPNFQQLMTEATAAADKKIFPTDKRGELLRAIHSAPACHLTQENLAQFFTPSDVALYSAENLLRNYAGEAVFDPCAGHGALLIAAALTLFEEHGLRGNDLVNKIAGCELDANTRLVAIENLTTCLASLAPDIAVEFIKEKVSAQLVQGDFNNYPSEALKNVRVISNPPYKEGPQGNVWIPIAEKLLTADISGIALIVPVAIASSVRTQGVRDLVFANFEHVSVLHHEIRPRPLFRNVDQRITILTAHKSEGAQRTYRTTGFLRHKAGERLSVWNAPTVTISHGECQGIFPKIAPGDLDFFREFADGGSRKAMVAKEYETSARTPVWVRTTGRYHLLAQLSAPEELTSKWKKLLVPQALAPYFIAAFENGELLRWWQIFGDGRDISITKLSSAYGVQI